MVIEARTEGGVRSACLRFDGVSRERASADHAAPARGPSLLLPSDDWIGLGQVVEVWQMMKKLADEFRAEGTWPGVPDDEVGPLDARVRPLDRHPGWIPIGYLGGAFDKIHLDLAPAPTGVRAQLICAGGAMGPALLATSLDDCFARLLAAYDGGSLSVDSDGVWRTACAAPAIRLP